MANMDLCDYNQMIARSPRSPRKSPIEGPHLAYHEKGNISVLPKLNVQSLHRDGNDVQGARLRTLVVL